MADQDKVSGPASPDRSTVDKTSYEPPRLIPLGNLNDLLAGGGSKDCDSIIPQPGPQTGTC
jgi:hypothetical protein